MPNRKNALLQIKKDAKRRERNMAAKAKLKTTRKNFEQLLSKGNKETVQSAFQNLSSVVDKTVKKGVIPAGRGSRIKSRYAAKINNMN